MKKFIVLLVFLIVLPAHAFLVDFEAHQRYIYPVVRVTSGPSTGSGTIIYSRPSNGVCSTYVLTNHHVISSSIRIIEEWSSALKKQVKVERRGIVYVEIFKYRNLSTPVGTMRIEADIAIYNESEDMALLKLRYDEPVQPAAKLPKKEDTQNYRVMDPSVAVGCSLGWPPLPSVGVITRLNFQIDSLPFDMSSAQIIYGNSGGAMFTEDGTLIGIPSRVAAMGWSGAVTHMGLFIPVSRIYDWLKMEHYDFIYDSDLAEYKCLDKRTKENEAKARAE